MNAALHENNMRCYRQVYTGHKTVEASGESVVPDTLPDIGMIGETTMHPLVRSKRAALGLVAMEGELAVTVSYLPDGAAGFSVLHLTLPWLGEFNGDVLTENTVIMGSVKLRAVETKLMNPRKVLVKAQLDVDVTCYEQTTVSYCDAAEENSRIQVRVESMDCSVIGTVCEHNFVVTDEYPLSEDLHDGEILHQRVNFCVDDVKTIANKLVVKGSALSDAVLAGPSGNIQEVSFTTGFSFIAETDCDCVTSDIQSIIFPTGVFYNVSADGKSLSMEVHGVCQIAVYVEQNLQYIADAYSNLYACQIERKPLELVTEMKAFTRRETLTEELSCKAKLSEIVFLTANALAPVRTGDGVQIPINLSACVAYEGGSLDWVKKTSRVNLSLSEDEWVNHLRILDFGGTVSGNDLSLRLTVEAEIIREKKIVEHVICEISYDEQEIVGRNRPSLTVVRSGGSMWDLARKYGSTVELIAQYNEIDEDPILPNTLLLIPKQRII